MSLVDRFIAWAVARTRCGARQVVTFSGVKLFRRYEFFRPDEWPDALWEEYREKYPTRPGALPWWLPVNVFLHCWDPEPGFEGEAMHDHPRWSITICLKGRIIERTPWSERVLRPGSFVFRSRKAIHGFKTIEGEGEVWTLFIVGRRKHRQNTYVVEHK